MSDIFKLFDGSMGAGGAASITNQNASSFSDVSSENDVVSTLASGTDSVDLLVDYSDFANFVTFNSAVSYVTLTADSILNSYPVGGTVDDAQVFLNAIDGYQRFFLANWPAWSGHLRLNPAVSASYIRVDDVGFQGDASRTSFLSPGTGSLSIQGWIDVPTMTGSNDVQVVFQKLRQGSSDGCTVYSSGSSVYFRVVSGSTDVSVSASLSVMPSFFAAVLDRTGLTGSLSMYAGTTGSFPILYDSKTIALSPRFDLVSGSFFMGSGSVSGKVVRPFTGSIDSVSVWSIPRVLGNLTGSYNRKVYSQDGLIGSWQFNDASPMTPAAYASIVRDRSGHRLDGRIQQFFSASLGSGSFVNDVPDPILSLDDPNVISYIVGAQVSASLYDRNNRSLIFNLFPDSFTQDDPVSAQVFSNFALALARHFDRIKLYANRLPSLRRVAYGGFDQSPDELLEEVGRYFGWELRGSFSTTDALRYFVGRGVRVGPNTNASLDTRLSQIKSELWRRVLLSLPYLYKTKGTAESVEALLRSYGIDAGFVRLKEYARKEESRFPVERVQAEKSIYSMRFSGGGNVVFSYDQALAISTNSLFAVMGDSNSNGKADPAKADSAFNITTANGAVLFNGRSAAGASVDPPVWTDFDVDLTMRSLAPRATTFGMEMGLASVLLGPVVAPAISQVGIDGSSLSGNWLPTSPFMLATTGKNLFNTWVARQQSFELSLGRRLSGVVVSLGTNDAGNTVMSNGFQANMTATIAAIRAVWPNIPIAWVKTNPTTTGGANVATVIAAQIAAAASDPFTILVDNSDLTIATDLLHYTANSIWTVGARAAIGILDTAGYPRRTTTIPTVIGWGPAEQGTGSIFPNSAPDVRQGDVEIMAVLMGVATGSFTIGTPSGWIPVTSSDSQTLGIAQHLALFKRAVTSSAISGAFGHASSSLVSGSDNRMTAKVFNVRGPTANPTINASSGFGPNTFDSGPTLIPALTASANSAILSFIGAWCGSSPTTTQVNGTLTAFGPVQDGAYPTVFTDREVISLSTGTLAVSGSTGITTVTMTANSIKLAATLAIS